MNYLRFCLAIIIANIYLLSPPAAAQVKPKTEQTVSQKVSNNNEFIDRGTEIVLNGKIITAPWAIWKEGSSLEIGISDTVLAQQFGVQLFDNRYPERQAANWDNGQRSPSMSLHPKLSQQYRYLSIAYFRRNGWQSQVVNGKLQLNTPPTKVLSVQRETIPKNGKINVRIDRYTPWKLSQTPTEGYLTIEATAAPTLLAQFNAPPPIIDNNLDPDDDPTAKKLEYKVTSNNNQTIVQFPIIKGQRAIARYIGGAIEVSINPTLETIINREINWAPGIRWNQKWVKLGNDHFPVSYIEIDPRQKGLTMRPMLAIEPTLIGTNHLIKSAPTTSAAVAINGGYFNRNNRMPLGALKRNGTWLSSPILNRGAIGWNDRGQIRMARLKLEETLTTATGERLPISTLNSAYAQTGIGRYTSDWGKTYSPIQANELIFTIQQNKVTQISPGTAPGSINIPIPPNGYLLALRGQTELSASIPIGTTLTLQRQLTPPELDNYPQIVAAGPLLVQQGKIVLDAKGENFSPAFGRENAARSAIASTPLGNIILVAVHDRAGGKGPTLAEMAQLLQQMGAVDALNLDGGSSTSLYLGGQLINRASATAARVHNGIGVFITP